MSVRPLLLVYSSNIPPHGHRKSSFWGGSVNSLQWPIPLLEIPTNTLRPLASQVQAMRKLRFVRTGGEEGETSTLRNPRGIFCVNPKSAGSVITMLLFGVLDFHPSHQITFQITNCHLKCWSFQVYLHFFSWHFTYGESKATFWIKSVKNCIPFSQPPFFFFGCKQVLAYSLIFKWATLAVG